MAKIVRRKTELSSEALAGLGSERLARLLMDHAALDRRLEEKLKLVLAAGHGEEHLVAALASQIGGVRRGRRFIPWAESAVFAHEIDAIRLAILDAVGRIAPRSAAKLLADFVHTSDKIFERADDSDGVIADVYRQAVTDWGRVSCEVSDRETTALAALVFAEFKHNGYGVKDGVIQAFANALGTEGLSVLRRLFLLALQDRPAPNDDRWDYERTTLLLGLAEVADACHDVDAFVDAMTRGGRAEMHANDIARRMLSAGRPREALDWLDRGHGRSVVAQDETVDLRVEALEALGRHSDAQAVRWDYVSRTLSLAHFQRYLEGFDELARRRAMSRAIAIAQNHEQLHAALRFLSEIGACDAAEQLIVSRSGRLDGEAYEVLRPVAKALAPMRPLGAVVLYRAMAQAVLTRAQSKYYRYAAADVARAGQLAADVIDWQSVDPHPAFMEKLRAEHGRKHAFWARIDGS